METKNIFKSIYFKIFVVIAMVLAFWYFGSEAKAGSITLNNLDFEIQLNEDGSMDVTENWDARIYDTNTMFKAIHMNSTKFKEITDVEIIQVFDGLIIYKTKDLDKVCKLKFVNNTFLLLGLQKTNLDTSFNNEMSKLVKRLNLNFSVIKEHIKPLKKKNFKIMAIDKNTDIGRIAESGHFGVWCESGDLNAAITNIDRLAKSESLRKDLGEAGYKFLLDNYTVDKSVDTILEGLTCTNISSKD